MKGKIGKKPPLIKLNVTHFTDKKEVLWFLNKVNLSSKLTDTRLLQKAIISEKIWT